MTTVVALPALVAELLADAARGSSGRAARTVVGGDAQLRSTVVALLQDRELAEHETPGTATLQVLRGRARLVAGESGWELAEGDVLRIPDLRHRLEALTDTAVLLTVARP